MKRLAPIALAISLFLAVVAGPGCGGEEPADPYDVMNRAFAGSGAGTGAEVEVASLGFEDQPLRTRTLELGPGQYLAIHDALASPQAGLERVVGDLENEGTEEIDGVKTDHVSGRLLLDELIGALVVAVQNGAGVDEEGELLPGMAELGNLREQLVDGDFDLYAGAGEGEFERLDLTLSFDDRENALPPTRIRFSLTESETSDGTS